MRDERTLPVVSADDRALLSSILSEHVSASLFDRFGSLSDILDAHPSALRRVHGVGEVTVRALCALGLLLERAGAVTTPEPRLYLTGPEDVADMFLREMGALDREHFRAILLNTKNRILGVRTISVGSLNASIVHAREVFRSAVREGAQAIVLVHNHPSGLPEPSSEDCVVTERLAEAGHILGVEILDHIIIGSQGFVSLKELGHL
jgi:DNA repair protein RadC